MLRGLCLVLVGAVDERHQGDVYEHALPLVLEAYLAHGFKKRLAFYVAYRAAYLRYDYVRARLCAHGVDKPFYLVGDMRNHLHGAAEIGALALLSYHVVVYLARGKVGILVGIFVNKALVMPQIEVGFRAVFGNENFAVLVGAHGARVHVYIGVELLRRHLIPLGLQQSAEGSHGNALTKSRNDSARYKDILAHTSSEK